MAPLFVLMTLAPTPAWTALDADRRKEWLQNIVAALAEYAVPTEANGQSGVIWSRLVQANPPFIAMLWVFIDSDAVDGLISAMARPDVQEYFTTFIVANQQMTLDDIFTPFLSI